MAFTQEEQAERKSILDGEFLYIKHSPMMDSDRLMEKLDTMGDKTMATAIANSEIRGLQIGQSYGVVSATVGKSSDKGNIKVRDGMKIISMSWKEYRTSFDGTTFNHDDWKGKDQFKVLND